jgi:putative ABC transport system permease protein
VKTHPEGRRIRSALIYSWVLRLYPRRFRERFGERMADDFEVWLADRRDSRGVRGVVSGWFLAARDVVASVPSEWRRERGRRKAPSDRAPAWGGGPGRRGGGWETTVQDVHFALRTLGRNRGFTAMVILVMGLGIGATTLLFSALDRVVLRPLPWPDADRLVRFYEVNPQGQDFSTSQPDFVDFRDRTRAFADMAAFTGASFGLVGDGEPVRLRAQVVSRGLFDLLGAQPIVGRVFEAEEDRPGGRTRVAILSEGLWERRFGRDPKILKRTVVLDGTVYDIVGVLPADFAFPGPTDVWVPLAADPAYRRGDHRLDAIARLRPGITLEQAQADVGRVAREIGDEYPTNDGWSARLVTFPDWIIGPTLRRTMLVLLGSVGLLLLMACGNVSNLLLVRATARRRELGIRWALGAGRRRIARQLLTESGVLGLLGGAVGVGLAYAAVPLLRRFSPAGVPRIDEVAIDGRVLLFSLGVSLVTSVIFGLVPVVQASRRDAHDVLRDGARVDSRRGRRVRDMLVVAELALATMLLVGAGLLLQSFRRLQSVDSGYIAENVLAVPVSLTGARYSACGGDTGQSRCGEGASPEVRSIFMREVIERLAALPAVVAAGATNITPLTGGSTGQGVNIEGRVPRGPADVAFAAWRVVTPGFFEATGVPIVRGRNFTDAEAADGAPFVLVSAAAARKFWPGENAVGKRLALGETNTSWVTVIGVAGDVRDVDLTQDPLPIVYPPYGGFLWPYMTLVVRVHGDPAALAESVRRTVWAVDPQLPVPVVRTLASYRSDSMASQRFSMALMSLFATMALVLAVLGVYGVTTFSVSRRNREIGLRMALGAKRRSVIGMVLGHALILVGVGTGIGAIGALASSRFLGSLLYDTPTADARVYAIVAATLFAVTVVSGLLPAGRAARIDPRTALAAD